MCKFCKNWLSEHSVEGMFIMSKFNVKMKYFLTLHYFVLVMSTFPYCACDIYF